MGLTVSKGNMYTWITHTWNPIKGECPHGCTYCYMHRWGKQKPVRLDESEFKTDLGTGNFIFVGSSCDMFADLIDESAIEATLKHCNKFNNQYLFQTKNPARISSFGAIIPDGSRLCTTIETNRWYNSIMGNTPEPRYRAAYMHRLSYAYDILITIEPIMDFDLEELLSLIRDANPMQVNIGFNTSYKITLPEPSEQKTIELITELKKFTKVKLKCNSQRVIKDKSLYL